MAVRIFSVLLCSQAAVGQTSIKPTDSRSPLSLSWSTAGLEYPPHNRPGATNTTCYDGAWPLFKTQQDISKPWSDYLTMVYGELPSEDSFPLCMGDLWLLYDKLLDKAGVTDIPALDSRCPTDIDVDQGQHYGQNNNFCPEVEHGEPGSTSWIWHPKRAQTSDGTWVNNWPWFNAPLPAHEQGGIPDNMWIEVTHMRDPWAQEAYGMWFFYARGSGIWFNMGRTLSFNGHQEAMQWLCNVTSLVDWCNWPVTNYTDNPDLLAKPGDGEMTKAIRQLGYDSVQFVFHDDGGDYRQCQGHPGYPMLNIEILAVGLSGEHSCGVRNAAQGSPSIGAGWRGQRHCDCDNDYKWLFCQGYGSQTTQAKDWEPEAPQHYAAYPCIDGERWSTLSDEGLSVGCLCAPRAGGWAARNSSGSWPQKCPPEAPDFYTVLPKPNLKFDGKEYCSLECRYDDDCGEQGQQCYFFADGNGSACVWDLMLDGTCDQPGLGSADTLSASVASPNTQAEDMMVV